MFEKENHGPPICLGGTPSTVRNFRGQKWRKIASIQPATRRKNAEVAVATAPEEVDDVDALLKEPEPQRTHSGGGGEIGWFKLPPALGTSP